MHVLTRQSASEEGESMSSYGLSESVPYRRRLSPHNCVLADIGEPTSQGLWIIHFSLRRHSRSLIITLPDNLPRVPTFCSIFTSHLDINADLVLTLKPCFVKDARYLHEDTKRRWDSTRDSVDLSCPRCKIFMSISRGP